MREHLYLYVAATMGVLVGCGSVPDITFSDGGLDGATDGSAAADSGSDGAGNDGGIDGTAGDAGDGCPATLPVGYDGCCPGGVLCRGTCNAAACTKCLGQTPACTGNDICCARNPNATQCKPVNACQ